MRAFAQRLAAFLDEAGAHERLQLAPDRQVVGAAFAGEAVAALADRAQDRFGLVRR